MATIITCDHCGEEKERIFHLCLRERLLKPGKSEWYVVSESDLCESCRDHILYENGWILAKPKGLEKGDIDGSKKSRDGDVDKQ